MILPPVCQERASRLMKFGYVYLLQSLTRDTFYLGWTTDLKRRIQEHNSGESGYTKPRGPWQLIACEVYSEPESVKKHEYTLKHNPRIFSYFKKRAFVSFRKGSAILQSRIKQVVR